MFSQIENCSESHQLEGKHQFKQVAKMELETTEQFP